MSDKYGPFVPTGAELNFGGRTSPTLVVSADDLQFVWRSISDGSLIILRHLNLSKNELSDELVIGKLGEEPFNSAPSSAKFQNITNAPIFIWSINGSPIIYNFVEIK